MKASGCPAPSVPDAKCCSDVGDCKSCNNLTGTSGCQWCLAGSGQCVNGNAPCPQDPGFAGKLCCQTNPNCTSCQQDSNCAFCLVDRKCREKIGALCDNAADPLCCNAEQGGSCASCISDVPGCSFCTSTRQCSNGNCPTVAVVNASSWQCQDPVLLVNRKERIRKPSFLKEKKKQNCESIQACGTCVSTSGCVWIPAALVNGQPVPSGGLVIRRGFFFFLMIFFFHSVSLEVCLG